VYLQHLFRKVSFWKSNSLDTDWTWWISWWKWYLKY
jgi:hypothetical protein